MTRPIPVLLMLSVLLVLLTKHSFAQAERFYPESTKGFVSITDLNDFVERLDKTSIGDLRRNPEAKEFFDSFVQQVKIRIQRKSKVSLGLTLDELKSMVSGEVSVGLIQPKENLLAIVTLAEYDKPDVVDKALAKIKANLLKKKADPKDQVKLVQQVKEAGQTVNHYEFPDPFGIAGPPQVFYGRTDKYIVAYSGPVLSDTNKADHVAQVKKLLKALAGEKQPSLADRALFKSTMKNVMAGGDYKNHQMKWFVESFGFVDAAKKVWPDQLEEIQWGSFRKVGFDAIKSGGGLAMVTPGDREIHVRAFVYAPPVDEKNRFKLAAKMLDFTAEKNRLLDLPVWAEKTSSSYMAMHVRMLNAFDSSKSLVDELYGEGFMDNVLRNFRENKKLKANFDLRNELAANLDDRIVAIRDPKFPAKLDNNRVVFAIGVAKEPTLSATSSSVPKQPKVNGTKDGKKATKKLTRREQVYKVLKGFMTNEDANFVEKIDHKINGKTITIFKKTIPKEDEEGGEPNELNLDDDDLDLDELDNELADDPKAKEGDDQNDQIIKYFCIAQYEGQVFLSPDLEFMKQVLDRCGKNQKPTLADMDWFKKVNAELDNVKGSNFESMRYVLRLDLPYRSAFQLIKDSKGDLPIEKLIKKIFQEDEKTRLYDLKKLPKDFDKSIAPHLGYVGWSTTTEKDGWMLNGIIVRKQSSSANKPE